MSSFINARPRLRSVLISVLRPSIWGNKSTLRTAVIWLLPLAMWATLWISLQSGNVDHFFKPVNYSSFFQEGIRAILPIFAASWALVAIFNKLYHRRTKLSFYLSPLGLLLAYGAIGFASALLSLDIPVSLYWAGLYISVPLVLWVVLWEENGHDRLHLLLNISWLAVLAMTVVLFIIAVVKLDLAGSILNPHDLLTCKSIGPWHGLTSGVLRSTGVGRYAAIAAIIAFSFLWRAEGWPTSGRGRYRQLLWVALLFGAVILLLSTGARTSIIGALFGALVVFLLYNGKKGMLISVVAIAAFIPLGWGTGIHIDFLDGCIFTGMGRTTSSGPADVTGMGRTTSSGPADATGMGRTTSSGPDIVSGSGPDIVSGSGPAPAAGQEPDFVSGSGPAPAAGQEPDFDGVQPVAEGPYQLIGQVRIPRNFFNLSGRTGIWEDGLDAVGDSPLLGHGFQADRLILGTHMHNAFLQSLIQTGIIGATVFMGAIVISWILMIGALRNLNKLPTATRHTIILAAGLLVFLSIRSIPESTGAFFGVDLLILAPILVYIEVAARSIPSRSETDRGSGSS